MTDKWKSSTLHIKIGKREFISGDTFLPGDTFIPGDTFLKILGSVPVDSGKLGFKLSSNSNGIIIAASAPEIGMDPSLVTKPVFIGRR